MLLGNKGQVVIPTRTAILRSTSASDHRIFSFARRGGWPCLHHARFTEPLHSCRRGHSAFVQTEHLPPFKFCPADRELEEEEMVKVKVGCAVPVWENDSIDCWPDGGTGWNEGLSSMGEFSHPAFKLSSLSIVFSVIDWLYSLSAPCSEWAGPWNGQCSLTGFFSSYKAVELILEWEKFCDFL